MLVSSAPMPFCFLFPLSTVLIDREVLGALVRDANILDERIGAGGETRWVWFDFVL